MARAAGARIGVKYGQGFVSAEPLRINDPMTLIQSDQVTQSSPESAR